MIRKKFWYLIKVAGVTVTAKWFILQWRRPSVWNSEQYISVKTAKPPGFGRQIGTGCVLYSPKQHAKCGRKEYHYNRRRCSFFDSFISEMCQPQNGKDQNGFRIRSKRRICSLLMPVFLHRYIAKAKPSTIPQAIMIPYQAIFSPSIPKRFSIAYRFNSLFPRFSQSTRSIR